MRRSGWPSVLSSIRKLVRFCLCTSQDYKTIFESYQLWRHQPQGALARENRFHLLHLSGHYLNEKSSLRNVTLWTARLMQKPKRFHPWSTATISSHGSHFNRRIYMYSALHNAEASFIFLNSFRTDVSVTFVWKEHMNICYMVLWRLFVIILAIQRNSNQKYHRTNNTQSVRSHSFM